MSRTLSLAVVVVVAAATPIPSFATSANAAASAYKNCAALNRAYPNGVGRKGAVDKADGKAKSNPVRNFRVDTKLYNSLPKTLDRDRDGVACEKHTGTSAPTRPVPKPAPKPAKGRVVSSTSGFSFVTPSGNITCAAGPSDVRCDIHEFTYRLPRRPTTCDTDYGQGMHLRRTAGVLCAGDTLAGSAPSSQNWFRKAGLAPLRDAMGSHAVLPYEWTLNSTQISCTSATTGVTCVNTTTRHGFTLSKAAYRVF